MGTANQIEQELMSYISDHKIRNTHSHHLPEQAMVDFDLDKLINNTYLQWQQVTPGTTAESRTAYLEKTRYKSYFVWLQKAIGELYRGRYGQRVQRRRSDYKRGFENQDGQRLSAMQPQICSA